MSVELEMVYVESSEIRESCVVFHADNAEMSFPIWLNVSRVYAESAEISPSIADSLGSMSASNADTSSTNASPFWLN